MVLSQKLAKLERLANKLGVRVVPGNANTYIPTNKIITVNMRQKPEKRAWSIAHEIGHVLTLDLCIVEMGIRALTGADHELPCLEAEIRAWYETDKIMRKLKLFSNEYIKYKHACIRSYYCSLNKK